MQNTEGVHRPPLSQKAPAPIACPVFFGQKPALYGQKTPVFYPKSCFFIQNTEGEASEHDMFNSQNVANIVKPTLLAYLPPKNLATGTAVIIAPPGGFHILSIINHGI